MSKEKDEKNVKRCPRCGEIMGINIEGKDICPCEQRLSADETYGHEIKITKFHVWCQIRKVVMVNNQPVWAEQIDYPEFCPAEFDTIEEAETYGDDLMVGE